MTFLRLFSGCMLQLVPFCFLALYPLQKSFRFSRRKMWILCSILLTSLSLIFAGVCCFLQAYTSLDSIPLFRAANTVFYCCLILCMIVYIYCIKNARSQKLFIFFFTLTSAFIITFLDSILETLFSPPNYNGLPYNATTLLSLSLITAIILPLLILLLKKFYIPFGDHLTPKENICLTLLSVVLFLMLAVVQINWTPEDLYNSTTLALLFTVLFAVFGIYFAFFKMLYYAHENLMKQQALAQRQHQLELNEKQYRNLVATIENDRRMHHDLRHHVIMLQTYLKNMEYQKIEEFLNNSVRLLDNYHAVKFCSNSVANMVLNYYYSLALQQDIAFTARIDLPKELAIQDEDLSVLLGNLLENAIEAASASEKEKRFIRLNIIRSGQMFAFTIDNSYRDERKTEGARYLSTKIGHSGVGLRSIELIAQKYNGGVLFQHKNHVFSSSVMLVLIETPSLIQAIPPD